VGVFRELIALRNVLSLIQNYMLTPYAVNKNMRSLVKYFRRACHADTIKPPVRLYMLLLLQDKYSMSAFA